MDRVALSFLILSCGIGASVGQAVNWTNVEPLDIYATPIRKAPPTTRIVGGRVETPHAHPFQVALQIDNQYLCGGTLISRNFVLTAAHCTSGASKAIVILGAHNLNQREPTQVIVESTSFITHKEWNKNTRQNDIALVKLPKAVNLNKNIATIGLASGSKTYAGEKGQVTGWGRISASNNQISYELKELNVDIITNSECARNFGSTIKDSNICTSGRGRVGSCEGDSGGPLVAENLLVGVVSFGAQNCAAGYPTAYSRVSSFYDWILQNSDL